MLLRSVALCAFSVRAVSNEKSKNKKQKRTTALFGSACALTSFFFFIFSSFFGARQTASACMASRGVYTLAPHTKMKHIRRVCTLPPSSWCDCCQMIKLFPLWCNCQIYEHSVRYLHHGATTSTVPVFCHPFSGPFMVEQLLQALVSYKRWYLGMMKPSDTGPGAP